MDLLTKMVEHHVWLTGEIVERAARLSDEQLDEPIELNVDDDHQTIRVAGRPGWSARWACGTPRSRNRAYDWSVEEHESRRLAAQPARARGPGVPRPRPRGRRAGPPRRHLRRRAVRARRGVHLRRDDRPRADVRRAPPLPGGDGARPSTASPTSAGATRCAGSPSSRRSDRGNTRPVEWAGGRRPLPRLPSRPSSSPSPALCRRFDLPAPLVLVALGAAASFLPFVPEVHLTSEVVLVGLLPPLLYAAALQTSLVDFNANRRRDPAAVDRAGRVHHRRGRGGGLHRDPGRHLAGRLRARCGRRAAGRRRRRPRSPAGSASRGGSSRSSRASRCSTTRPPWSRCAPRSPSAARHASPRRPITVLDVGLDFLLAAAGGVARRPAALLRRRPGTAPGHRPGASTPACRWSRRSWPTSRPRRSTARACSPWSSPACCSATRRRSCRPRRPGSRSG